MSNLPAVIDKKETLPTLSHSDHRKTFERIIYKMTEDADHAFLSCVLQSMNTMFVNYIPTAGVCFNHKSKLFELRINPEFFNELKDDKERTAVMIHEVYHILHKHVFIPPEKLETLEKRRLNVAMDLVINQLIKDLPDMCWTLDKVRDKNKKPFPANETFEEYYDLLDGAEQKCPKCGQPMDGKGDQSDQSGDGDESKKKSKKKDSSGKGKSQQSKEKGEGDQSGEGGGQGNSQDGHGHGEGEPCDHPGHQSEDTKGGSSAGSGWHPVDLRDWDQHDWSEADIKERLDATRDLIKRALQKNSYTHSRVPGFVEDCLEKVESAIKKLNYKELLLKSLKQSLPSKDTRKTWTRPSRRYGDLAKGNMAGKLPMVHFHGDSSGSISHEELNEFLKVTMNFFTVGISKAWFHLFHTELYYKERITKTFKLNPNNVQSGGTDIGPSVAAIEKARPDMAVFLTDGYFSEVPWPKGLHTNVVWVISKGGNASHPMKHIGVTVTY